MSKGFKPLLAATLTQDEIAKLPYPMYLSAKLDGIRAVIRDGVVYSRNLKRIPNEYGQLLLGQANYNGCDGELIVGPSNAENVYNVTVSGVMSEDGEPDVRFCVFDDATEEHADEPYKTRYERIQKRLSKAVPADRIHIMPQNFVDCESTLLGFEKALVGDGYEGVMVRSLTGKYKHGRSTNREANIFKLKRFSDSEAEILGFEELYKNMNDKQVNELGNSFRSSHKDNLMAMNTLGALVVRDIKTGIEFNIGSGYTQEVRDEIWANRDKYLGKLAKYKHFEVGVKDKPRFPVFIGMRSEIDL
jgi:DNA ligase-1